MPKFNPLLSIPQGVEKLKELSFYIPLPVFISFLRPMGSLVARLNIPILVGTTSLRHLPSRSWKSFLEGMDMTCAPTLLPRRSLVLVMRADILDLDVMRTMLGAFLELSMTQVFSVVLVQPAFVGRSPMPRCEKTRLAGALAPLTVSP